MNFFNLYIKRKPFKSPDFTRIRNKFHFWENDKPEVCKKVF